MKSEDRYQEEMRIQAAAKAKVEKLEKQLAKDDDRGQNSNELLSKRKELADLKSKRLLEYRGLWQ
ncbi:MAG: hypothetical protein U5L96_03435 [Owenweeksia sp.]|nr:hypothetical protein [Owenweeksia sp.]